MRGDNTKVLVGTRPTLYKGGRIFMPKGELRKYLIRETHDPQWAGHPGRERVVALLSRTYYWPKMEDDVKLYVKTCVVC